MGGPNGFVDPSGVRTTMVNRNINFGWEFVWHCHILSHEEMDMMHALSFAMAPKPPTGLIVKPLANPFRIQVTWTNTAANATAFVVQRASDADFTQNLQTWTTAGLITSLTDTAVVSSGTYYYRVQAINVVGDTVVYPAPAIGYPHITAASNYSPTRIAEYPAAPSNLTASSVSNGIQLTWTDNAISETQFMVRRRPVNASNTPTGPWIWASATVPASPGSGLTVTWIDTTSVVGSRYQYQIYSYSAFGISTTGSNTVYWTR